MFCNNCGAENPEGAKFCHSCGSKLIERRITPESKLKIELAKSDDKEISFYSDDKGVRITNTRAIFGNKTYAMANISSISIGKKDPNYVPGIIIALVGFIFLFIRDLAVVGFIILIIAVLVLYFTKGEYSVRITSASGETDAVSSSDKGYIQNIVNSMNEAIIKRG